MKIKCRDKIGPVSKQIFNFACFKTDISENVFVGIKSRDCARISVSDLYAPLSGQPAVKLSLRGGGYGLSRFALFIPKGFANSFCVTGEKEVNYLYLVDSYYDGSDTTAIAW
ncbi:MAG: hypothetical protein AAB875_06725, partial [Patescibacteria group bacterium]